VLLTDREAEHLPGCNLSIRRRALEAIGGFDPAFRTAGDDVDVCWRLRERGGSLGFHASALVWPHRRGTLRAYWRQQRGYGRAEGLLEAKWPEKYNAFGRLAWGGRVYAAPRLGRYRIYHGVWGTAPFQSLYGPGRPSLSAFALMPEWLLASAALAGLALLGLSWPPLLLAGPLAAALAAASCACARLRGRVESGLTPWRRRRLFEPRQRGPRRLALWAERGREPRERMLALEARLRETGGAVLRGGAFARFDLEVRAGVLGAARLLMAVEEHAGGQQLVRLRRWARPSGLALGLALGAGALAAGAVLAQAWVAAAVLGASAAAALWRIASECASAQAAAARAIDAWAEVSALLPLGGGDAR